MGDEPSEVLEEEFIDDSEIEDESNNTDEVNETLETPEEEMNEETTEEKSFFML